MRLLKVSTILGALVLLVGCSKENQARDLAPTQPNPGIQATPTPPTQTCGTNCNGNYSGSTVELRLDGGQTNSPLLAEFFYNSNPNAPTNIRINIDIRRTRDSVIVSYFEAGKLVEAGMGTQHPTSNVQNATYNQWYSQNGQIFWKGFFQDKYGAMVLVIDRALSQGDGQPPSVVGGSIWFQNFDRNFPNNPEQGPLSMCWQITLGPYDCRTFLVNNVVNMLSSLYPNNRGPNASMNYKKLGEFDGIGRVAAGL